MSSSYQARGYQRPEEEQPSSNVAELIGTGLLAGAGLGSIAGIRLGRGRVARGMDPKKKETIRKLAELNKKPAANAGVRQKDLNTPSTLEELSTQINKDLDALNEYAKTDPELASFLDKAYKETDFAVTPPSKTVVKQLPASPTVNRPNTFVDDYVRDIAEQRIGEQQVEDALQAFNLTKEARSERARQYANVRRVQAAAADDVIDGLRREATVDQSATAVNSGANQEIGRVKHRLQQNEDVNLAKIERAEDLADTAIQQQVQKNNIPLTETPNRDAGINLVSSQSVDGLPVDQAEIVATGQGSVQGKQILENAGLPSGSSSVNDLSTTNVAAGPVDAQQFVADELQSAVANFDSRVQQLMTSGSGMSRARAEKIVLGDEKITTTQGRQLKEKIEQDLEQATALDPEDASNIAGSVINPITGQREVSSVQKVGAGYAVRGYERKPFEQRSIPNVDPETNEALIKSPAGKAIKGRAPSYYEVPPKEQVRELPGPFKEEVPDRRTATRGGFGAALQKSIEEEGVQPAKMPEGGFAGVGIYGEDLKYVPGPAGAQASRKPTGLPVSRTTGEEFNPLTPRERSGLKDMSNQGLRNIVAQGTYRSGKVSKPAKAAQTELNIRANYTSPDFDPKKVSSTDVKTSLEASEEMRRARIEGRNPQEALKTFMEDKGLTGDFSLLSEKPANPTQPLPTKQATPEKQVKKGKTGSALGAFLNKNYYSVNKFPSV